MGAEQDLRRTELVGYCTPVSPRSHFALELRSFDGIGQGDRGFGRGIRHGRQDLVRIPVIVVTGENLE